MDNDPNLIALGKQIRKLRQKGGFTQESLAEKAGLNESYYARIERGLKNVSAHNLIRIAKALEVEVGRLFPKIKDL